MTLAWAVAVAMGAAIGAPLRFATERWFLARTGDEFPWGTLIVNVVGSAVLGAVLAVARTSGLSELVVTLIATGFCGALTTFSGFSAQVLELGERRSWRGVAYATGSLVAGVVAAALAHAAFS